MSWPETMEVLREMPFGPWQSWSVAAAAVALAAVLILFVESRFYPRRRGAWLLVRLGSLPMAAAVFAAVVLPARATSGMEGLAVFYALLFTVAPLLWFGYHGVAGALVRPKFTASETVGLAFAGLAVPVLLGAAAMAAYEAATRVAEERSSRPVPAGGRGDPLPHQVLAMRVFTADGVPALHAQSLVAPPGLGIERVEQRDGAPAWTAVTGWRETWCLDRGNVHFFWSAHEQAPVLRLHWRTADGRGGRTEFQPGVGATMPAAQPFVVRFEGNALRLSAPVPRERVVLELAQPDGHLNRVIPGMAPADPPACVGTDDPRQAWLGSGVPARFTLHVRPPTAPHGSATWSRSGGS